MQARDYQVAGVKFLTSGFGKLLADEMGLGKTAQAIWAASTRPGPILIISRPLNKLFWKQTIRAIDPDAPVHIAIEGGYFDHELVRKWFTHPRQRGYLIIHHEALQTPVSKKTGDLLRDVPAILRSFGMWEGIIVDEAHRLKGRKSQQTKSLWTLPTLYKWALSGQMQEKSPADYWATLHWFAPQDFKSYHVFCEAYVEMAVDWYGGAKIVGVKNAPALARRLAPYVLRRTKLQVLPDLPPKIYKEVPLELYPQQRRLYDKLAHDTWIQLQAFGGDEELFMGSAMKAMHYLRRCALDPSIIGTDVPSVKVDWLLDWAAGNDDQFVIFTASKVFADTFPHLLKDGATISGSVTQREREVVLEAFQKGKLRYIVGTIDTMAESINLQAAKTSIFMDPHFRADFMVQAEDRVHRMDTVESPLIVNLIAQDTVDEDIYANNARKLGDVELVHAALERLRKYAK